VAKAAICFPSKPSKNTIANLLIRRPSWSAVRRDSEHGACNSMDGNKQGGVAINRKDGSKQGGVGINRKDGSKQEGWVNRPSTLKKAERS